MLQQYRHICLQIVGSNLAGVMKYAVEQYSIISLYLALVCDTVCVSLFILYFFNSYDFINMTKKENSYICRH